MSLRIAHLYPSELGINGDVGNVTVLAHRARARGIDVDVVDIGRGADLPADIDLVHIGSGPFASVRAVHTDALRHGPRLRSLRDAGVPILAIGAGWELLGRRIEHAGGALEGLDVFPTTAHREDVQSVGESVVRDGAKRYAGFANHSSRTTLDSDARPLGQIVRGFGNDGSGGKDSGAEGARIATSVGTHLHGCVLGLNPNLADELLLAAYRRRTPSATLTSTDELTILDERAHHARAALSARVGLADQDA